MEEVQRMGECGDAIAIMREWEMKDEAVKWLTEMRGYVEVREKRGGKVGSAGINDDDDQINGEFVLLVQVQRDFESVREACKAGKEEVVVARSLVEGSDPGSTVCQLLASFSYLECPPRTAKSDDDDDDDHLRYYYRAGGCTLSLPAYSADFVNAKILEEANLSDSHKFVKFCMEKVDLEDMSVAIFDQNIQTKSTVKRAPKKQSCLQSKKITQKAKLSAKWRMMTAVEDDETKWQPCASFVMDTSKLPVQDPNLSLTNAAGSQTPLVGFVVNGFASADEFHLHLKLNVESLFVGVSKVQFLDTTTCLGFYPDWIRLSMEPGWQDMSVAIFDQNMQTESMPSKSTQNTEIKVDIRYVSVKRSWEKEITALEDDHELEHIEYETEGGGVASIEWKICRWKDGKRYKSDRPLSPSLISKKLPKLPFSGTGPCLQNLRAVSWRLPLNTRRQELSIKLRLLFDMQLISLTSTSTPFLKSPKHSKVQLEKEFPFTIQLPTSLV